MKPLAKYFLEDGILLRIVHHPVYETETLLRGERYHSPKTLADKLQMSSVSDSRIGGSGDLVYASNLTKFIFNSQHLCLVFEGTPHMI